MTKVDKRVEAAARVDQETRRLHTIWAEWDDTKAELQAKRDRMIAEGKALPDDKFIYIGWRAPQNSETEVEMERIRSPDGQSET
jgi:hypothetical protein